MHSNKAMWALVRLTCQSIIKIHPSIVPNSGRQHFETFSVAPSKSFSFCLQWWEMNIDGQCFHSECVVPISWQWVSDSQIMSCGEQASARLAVKDSTPHPEMFRGLITFLGSWMQADVGHVTASVPLEMSCNHHTPGREWMRRVLTWDRPHCCSPANRYSKAFQNHTAKSEPTVNTPQTLWLSFGPSGLRFFFSFLLGNGCVKVWRVNFDPIKGAEWGFLMFWLPARLGSARLGYCWYLVLCQESVDPGRLAGTQVDLPRQVNENNY